MTYLISMWAGVVANRRYVTGQMLARLGKTPKQCKCMTEVIDFYYGLLTEGTTEAQRAKLEALFDGDQVDTELGVPANVDEFEKLMEEFRS